MEKWQGETENLIKASEAGFLSNIKRQREQLEYTKKLEKILKDIYYDYTREEVEKHCGRSVVVAWEMGQDLEMVPTGEQVRNSVK